MKLMAPNGLEIKGTLERLQGVALINEVTRNEDGSVDYEFAGETEIWWDEQKTITRHGKVVFVDEEGNEWLSSELVPDTEDDDTDTTTSSK